MQRFVARLAARHVHAGARRIATIHARGMVSVGLVKQLRERTGAPILECKKALSDPEVDGDMDKAIDFLRKFGVAAAAKRSSNTVSEGLVAVATSDCGKRGAMVEINSETDFVARNELFQQLLKSVAEEALTVADESDMSSPGSHDISSELLNRALGDSSSVADAIEQLSGTVRENIQMRRAGVVCVEEGSVTSYVHNQLVDGMGTIGCLVGVSGDSSELGPVGHQVALHVAAANPLYLTPDSIPEQDVERERAVLMEQGLASGKPAEIVEKMVAGRMRKFYEDTVLTHQKSVVDEEGRAISKLVAAAAPGAEVAAFMRYEVGLDSADEPSAE